MDRKWKPTTIGFVLFLKNQFDILNWFLIVVMRIRILMWIDLFIFCFWHSSSVIGQSTFCCDVSHWGSVLKSVCTSWLYWILGVVGNCLIWQFDLSVKKSWTFWHVLSHLCWHIGNRLNLYTKSYDLKAHAHGQLYVLMSGVEGPSESHIMLPPPPGPQRSFWTTEDIFISFSHFSAQPRLCVFTLPQLQLGWSVFSIAPTCWF